MAIRTTRLKTVQVPKVDTIDLSSQMDGETQTFVLGKKIPEQFETYLIWNSTVYKNTPSRTYYEITNNGLLRTYFNTAPKGGNGRNLALVVNGDLQGESPTVTKQEMEDAIAEEAKAREDADEEIKFNLDVLDKKHTADLDAEIANRTSGDAENKALIDDLNTELDGEKTARENKDVELQSQIDTIVNSTDVRDIVNTYADLEAYDKSTLGDNDVIKVLNDETHDGAISYYRFIKADDNFKYEGSIGPYYTKAESDALLNAKQNTLIGEGEGQNIKTIGGQSVLGTGDIEVSGSDSRLTDDGATKANNLPLLVMQEISTTTNRDNNLCVRMLRKNLNIGSGFHADVVLPTATNTAAGTMSSSDKQKLGRVPQTVVSATGIRQTSDDNKTSILVKYKNVLTGEAYDDAVEIPTVSNQYNGLMSIAQGAKLDGLADIKTIGDNLSLNEDGVLSATSSGSSVALYDEYSTATDGANTAKFINDRLNGDSIFIGNDAYGSSLSIAIGNGAGSTGNSAICIGRNAFATGKNSIAIGAAVNSTNTNTIGIGLGATVNKDGAVAIGKDAWAKHSYAIAIGKESSTSRDFEFSVGSAVDSGYSGGFQRYVSNVKAGELDTDAVNLKQMRDYAAGTELYSGTASVNTITLSEEISNFERIEMVGELTDGNIKHQETVVYHPSTTANTIDMSLSVVDASMPSRIIYQDSWTLASNGTEIDLSKAVKLTELMVTGDYAASAHPQSTSNFAITKVIGYGRKSS